MLFLEVRLGESFSIAKNSVSILMVLDILVVIACKLYQKENNKGVFLSASKNCVYFAPRRYYSRDAHDSKHVKIEH